MGSLPILGFRQPVDDIDRKQFGAAGRPTAARTCHMGDLMASETYTQPAAQPRHSPNDRPGVPATLRPGLRPRQRTAPESQTTDRMDSASEAPRLRQLMGVCGWAAILGGVGLVIGIRDLIAV